VHDLSNHTRRLLAPTSFSFDGTRVVSASFDHTLSLWDAERGALSHHLLGHTDRVMAAAFSPDGALLASGAEDHTVILWDTRTGEARHHLKGDSGPSNAVAFSPVTNRLASAGDDGVVWVWSSKTAEPVHRLTGHSGRVNSVAFSPDGALLATGGEDRSVRVWDVTKGVLKYTLEGHLGEVQSVAFSPDGRRLATAAAIRADGEVKVWSLSKEGGAVMAVLQDANTSPDEVDTSTGRAHAVAFSPDGTRLVICHDNYTATVRDAAGGPFVHVLETGGRDVQDASWSPDGALIAMRTKKKSNSVQESNQVPYI